MVRLRLTEETLPPNGQTVTVEQIRWYISNDGGKTYELHTAANGKEVYSFKVTTAIDGRMIRCEARLRDGTILTDVAASEPITVEVTDRWVEIRQQPKGTTITLPTGQNYDIKVIARYATSYPREPIPARMFPLWMFRGRINTIIRSETVRGYNPDIGIMFIAVLSKTISARPSRTK